MLKKITAAALSTALCVTASIPFTGNCAAGVQPTNINLSAVRSADDIPVPADLRTGETPVRKGELGNNILYFLYEDGTVYIKGYGKMGDFIGTPFEKSAKSIKKAVFINDGDGITNIGNNLFCNCPELEEAELPDTVTSIGVSSFSSCPKLKKVNIPKAVTYVGVWAFADDTSIEAIELPDSLKLIDRAAFQGCTALKEVTFPEKLETLRGLSFQNCTSLTEVTVPENVTTIGPYAFSGCTSLKKALVKGGSKQLGEKLFEKCIALEKLTLPNADTAIFRENDAEPLKWLGTLFGSFVSGYTYGVGFANTTYYIPNSLQKVTITGGTKIADEAFYGFSSLTEAVIPDDTEYLGASSFSGCSQLKEFKMPSKATFIGADAFQNCTLINFDIPKGVKEIGASAFENCTSLTEINVPEATDKIGDSAFSGCTSLKKAVISTCNDGIGKKTFNKCTSLGNLTLPYAGFDPKNAASKDSSCLCQLFGEYISGYTYGVTYSGATYYVPSALEKITVTGGTNIPDDALYGFSSLTEVSIPDDTTYIGNLAFSGCSNLEKFDMPSKAEYIGNQAFNGCAKIVVDIPEGVTMIGERAFGGCTALTEINVPKATKEIGGTAFFDCTGLKKAVINGEDTIIGPNCFNKCISLESLTLPFVIPDTVKQTESESSWFKGLFGAYVSGYTYGLPWGDGTIFIPNSLKELNITNGKELPANALSGMQLENVTLPKTIESIGNSAFDGCNKILNVFYPDKQAAWDKVKVGEKNTVLDERLRDLGDDGEYHNVITTTTVSTSTTTTTTFTTTTAVTTTAAPVSDDYSLGDVDNNKAVNAVDASMVLSEYALTSTNKKSQFTEAQKKAADVDANGAINAVDASFILEYYAYTATTKEKPVTMSEYMAKKLK